MLAACCEEYCSCSLSPCKSVSFADFGSLHTLGHVMPLSGASGVSHERNGILNGANRIPDHTAEENALVLPCSKTARACSALFH
jgi:hypothetical protein